MYLTNRFYTIMITAIVMMAVGNYYPPLYTVGCVVMWFLLIMTITDLIMMYSRHAIHATRQVAERLSNGDDNEIRIRVESTSVWALKIKIIDETPFVFQRRDIVFRLRLAPLEGKNVIYKLHPTQRGVYGFGHIRVFATSPLQLVERRDTCDETQHYDV